MNALFIWWTNQRDCERVELLQAGGQVRDLPNYIERQLVSRSGRAGRGRLWADPIFNKDPLVKEGASWDDRNPWCVIAEDAGGIVIRSEDVERVRWLPGFVTTFSMTAAPH